MNRNVVTKTIFPHPLLHVLRVWHGIVLRFRHGTVCLSLSVCVGVCDTVLVSCVSM